MPTRFYMPATGAAAVNPAFGGWDESASADRLACDRVKISSAMTDKVVAKGTGATRALVRQYVSPQLEAQTIAAGTVKGQIRALESAANDNLDLVPLLIRAVSSDGNTYRTPAIIALGDYAAALEFATSLTNRKIADGDATSAVTLSDGDRIVIEIGIKNSGTGSSVSGSLNFGDNSATDLAEDTTTTAADNPWIELSQTIAFKVARTAPSGVSGVPDSTTEIDWTWTRGASDNTDVEWRLNGGSWTALGSPTQTTLTTSSLTPGTSYTLEVRNKWAVDTPYSSAASSAAVFTFEAGGWGDHRNAQQAPLKNLHRLSQSVQGASTGTIGQSSTNEAKGQKFTADKTGKLNRIRFHVVKGGSPTDSLVCKLYDDSSGDPGSLLATSLPVPAAAISGVSAEFRGFEFSPPPSLTSGTVYHAIVFRTGSLDVSNYYALTGDNGNPYSGGNIVRRSLGAWVHHTSEDCTFHFEMEGDDWYRFEIDRDASKLRAFRSTDQGVNWTEQDSANAPSILEGVGLFAAAVQRKGTNFYVTIPTGALELKRSFPFNAVSNTWGSATTVTLSSVVPIKLNLASVLPFHHNFREFSSQTHKDFTIFSTEQLVSSILYRRVGYQVTSGTGNYLTGSGTTVHYDPRSLVNDGRDWTYIFYSKSDSTQIQVATLATNDSAPTVVGGLSSTAIDQTAKYPLGLGCHFWRDGVNYVAVPYVDGGTSKLLYCETGIPANTAGNWTTSTITTQAAETVTSNPGFVVADSEQGGKLFYFFVDDSDGQVYWCHDDGSFAWTEPELFAATVTSGIAGTLSDQTVGMLLREADGDLVFKTFDVFF